jgi:predicted permease
MMTGVVEDLLGAGRLLRRAPGFALLCSATLGIGIGTVAIIFSVADPVLIRPLPFPSPDRLYSVWQNDERSQQSNLGYLTIADLSDAAASFQQTAAVGDWAPVLGRNGVNEQLSGLRVSWAYFRTLGVRPALGADFTKDDDAPSHNGVIILSHGIWLSHFGGDSAVVGGFANISGTPMRIAGVLARDYDDVLNPGTQVWRVLGYDATRPWACRTCQHLRMLARLRTGVTERAAKTEADAISARLVHDYPGQYAASGFQLVSLQRQASSDVRSVLLVLLAGVGLLLIIATVSTSTFQLARALRRDEEFSVRVALGASGGRLARQLIAEGVILAAVASVMALTLAWTGLRAVVSRLPATMPRVSAIHLDYRVFGLMGLITIVTGLAIGLAPIWHARRAGLASSLSGSRRVTGGRHRLRWALVASEVGVAVALLTGTGLLARSFAALMAVNPGFDVNKLATVQVQVSGPKYADSMAAFAWEDALLASATSVPGVRLAALANQLPLTGNDDEYGVQALDKPLANPGLAPSGARYTVTAGFLKAMGIPIFAGRDFEAADNGIAGAPVAIVSRSLARRIWGTESAIGKRIHFGEPEHPWYTVVGVAGDVHHRGLDVSETQQFYVPTRRWFFQDGALQVLVRTAGDPSSVLPALRHAALVPDPQGVITQAVTMDDVRSRSAAQRSLALGLFALFAGVALLLATTGVFGALAGAVAERRREIGLRIALGATPRDILVLVLREGLVLAASGAAIGVLVTAAGATTIRSMLFGVGVVDPATIGSVGVVVAAAAMAASLLPVWRAVVIDPSDALRGN